MVAMSCNPTEIDVEQLRTWKSHGFSDSHIADALNAFPASGYKSLPRGRDDSVMRRRHSLLHPNYRMVDSCAASSPVRRHIIIQLTSLVPALVSITFQILRNALKNAMLRLVVPPELVKESNLIMAVSTQLWQLEKRARMRFLSISRNSVNRF